MIATAISPKRCSNQLFYKEDNMYAGSIRTFLLKCEDEHPETLLGYNLDVCKINRWHQRRPRRPSVLLAIRAMTESFWSTHTHTQQQQFKVL